MTVTDGLSGASNTNPKRFEQLYVMTCMSRLQTIACSETNLGLRFKITLGVRIENGMKVCSVCVCSLSLPKGDALYRK